MEIGAPHWGWEPLFFASCSIWVALRRQLFLPRKAWEMDTKHHLIWWFYMNLLENRKKIKGDFSVSSFPVIASIFDSDFKTSISHDGSMVLVCMLTWRGYIDGIHVTIYSIHGSYGYLSHRRHHWKRMSWRSRGTCGIHVMASRWIPRIHPMDPGGWV